MVKEKRGERRGEWLIGQLTQNIPYLSIVTTLHKTKTPKASVDESKGA